MTAVPQEDNLVAFGDPSWQRIPVADLPVEDRRGFVNGCCDPWVQGHYMLANVFHISLLEP